MAPSGNFITWWNIVFPIKKVLFTLTSEVNIKSAYLKYSTVVIQKTPEIFPVPPSTDEGDTWDTLKEYLSSLVYTFPMVLFPT